MRKDLAAVVALVVQQGCTRKNMIIHAFSIAQMRFILKSYRLHPLQIWLLQDSLLVENIKSAKIEYVCSQYRNKEIKQGGQT